jgi:hypothetical protein
MLPQRYLELLTAYIDGEMSTRQRKTLLRVLHKSPEARALLQKLRADAGEIHRLPRAKLDGAFTLRVMEAIAERGLPPVSRPALAAHRPGLFRWTGWAAAAAVLVAVGAGAYLAFPLLVKNPRPRTLVEKDEKPPVLVRGHETDKTQIAAPRSDKKVVAQGPRDKRSVEPVISRDKPMPKKETATQVAKGTKADLPKKAIEPEPEKDVLGSLVAPDLPQISGPNLGVMMPLQDLEQKENKEKLQAKLKKDSGFHIQMLCRDTGKGFERLRRVLAANKTQLVIDQTVQLRLKNPKVKTTLVIYAENLKPDELIGILEQLGQADRKAATPKAPAQFGYVVVNSMSPAFRQRISKFLDNPPSRTSNGKSKGPLGVDIRKPVGEGTAAEVERKMKERDLARTQVKPGPGTAPVRQVLVLAYNEDKSPVHPRAAHSREVKQFRESRPQLQPGTLQVVLVLLRDSV